MSRHLDAVILQGLHPGPLGLESFIAVVPATVNPQNDLAAVTQVHGIDRVLADFDRLDGGALQWPPCLHESQKALRQDIHQLNTLSSADSSTSAFSLVNTMGGRILRMLSCGPIRLIGTPRSRMVLTIF